MKMAGDMVGIDLTKPIDCSQMNVDLISCEPYMEFSERIKIKRTTVLRTYIFNEEGEREELEITFQLKSNRMPKALFKDEKE